MTREEKEALIEGLTTDELRFLLYIIEMLKTDPVRAKSKVKELTNGGERHV